jgi:ArsR family transcriptional regulator, arsenate/arsenite/antimonite-responsive transcriptional repressor
METASAVRSLSALAHEGRLAIFRELVQAGPEGLAAGEIGRRLVIAPNTLSASLAVLSNAGLATSRREGRSIIYAAAYDRMSGLLSFLMADCCGGRPEICAPVAVADIAGICNPQGVNDQDRLR